MNNDGNGGNEQIRIVTVELMEAVDKNDRQFSEYMTEHLSKEDNHSGKISHATVINWRLHGKFPMTDFLEDVLCAYEPEDPRFKWALQCLAIKNPSMWGQDGRVWTLGDLKQSRA